MKTSPPPITATLSAVRSGIPGPLGLALACLLSTLAFANAQETETDTAKTSEPIPFDQIGAVAGRQYSGDAIGITVTQNGARLRAGFQKLEAQATHEGLWLNSTEKEGGRFRLAANSIGRKTSDSQLSIINSQLPPTGSISATENLVTFSRPFLIEEYSVSTDGIRQDFIIAERPAGNGDLRVELALKGASAESSAYGVKLTIDGSMRELAYSRLHVTDATGRELTASLEVLTSDFVTVRVNDTTAIYPVRIDPTFSDADWVSMNTGIPGATNIINATAVDGNGNLYIGGDFYSAGGVVANHVAKWDGSAWSALGSGMSYGNNTATVLSLAVAGNDLYAGGSFSTAGGVAANYIAKWNGCAWSALGSGISGGDIDWPSVKALAVSGTEIFVGGAFNTAGGITVNSIAKWNGSTWSALGTGMSSGYVYALSTNGTDLYAGGSFSTAGGVSVGRIAKWNGSGWSALGTGMGGTVYALTTNGTDLYAGGDFSTAGGVSAGKIAKWNGNSWSALGTGMNNTVKALTVSGSNLYTGGVLTAADGVVANYIAKWNGSSWSALGTGINNQVAALAVNGSDLYVGGWFTTVGGIANTKYIAKWNGSAWSALGSGMNGGVSALTVSGTDVYAGGGFTTAGGVAANNIAKWNGSTWSALGSGTNGFIGALVTSGAYLYAGGQFTTAGGGAANRIAKWNGSTWSALGSGMTQGGTYGYYVRALAVIGSDLYAGGDFAVAGGVNVGCIAKWNGSAWSALDSGVAGGTFSTQVEELAVNGTNLYVGGSFTTAGAITTNSIAKWDGGAWSALGAGINGWVRALTFSGTDLYAGGSFTTAGGVSAKHIAKWNGSAWSALGSGVTGTNGDDKVFALTAIGTDLYVGGNFTYVGTNLGSPFLAKANLAGSPAAPEIAIEQPLTSNVSDGGTRDFGSVALGANSSLTFIIKNTGTADLTGLAITKDGTDSADFTITTSPTAPVSGPSGSTTLTIRFSPTTNGAKTSAVHIASNDADENPYDITLTGPGASAAAVFNDTIAANSGLTGPDAAPTAIPFGDGVENLLKYAFNMNLSGPDTQGLVPGTGTAGLPSVTLDGEGSQTQLQMEYLRRTDSGLTYTPMVSATLNPLDFPNDFAPISQLPIVTPINGEWERVVVGVPVSPATNPRRFVFLRVTMPPDVTGP